MHARTNIYAHARTGIRAYVRMYSVIGELYT